MLLVNIHSIVSPCNCNFSLDKHLPQVRKFKEHEVDSQGLSVDIWPRLGQTDHSFSLLNHHDQFIESQVVGTLKTLSTNQSSMIIQAGEDCLPIKSSFENLEVHWRENV